MTREQQAIVSQVLAQIPENLREPLILFYREQQSTKQVAAQLGLSENAARQRISRARSMLREQVAAMVETTIARSRPAQAFTTAVVAAIAATAARTTSATAAAAGVSTGGSGLGATTALSGLAGKIAVMAAGLALVAGAVWVHRQTAPPDKPVPAVEARQFTSQALPTPQETIVSTGTETLPATQPTPQAAEAEATVDATPEHLSGIETTGRTRLVARPDPDAAPFEFKPTGLLSGMVTDIETGDPVPDALVRITKSRIFDTRTDANGFYSFDEIHEPGNFTIAVDSKDYVGIPWDSRCPILSLSKGKQAVRHFQLPKACMVDLWVVDANGVGIEGAKVVPTVPTDTDQREVSRFGSPRQTDPNGYILLGGFPPSQTDYQIAAWHTFKSRVEERDGHRHAYYAYDSAPACTRLRLNDPNRIPQVQIVLEQGQDVYGYAEYADGVPATDIEIVARPAWWHCKYGVEGYPVHADGTFAIKHITPGQYDICAHTTQPDFGGGVTKSIMQMQLPRTDGEPLVVRLPDKSPQALSSISGTLIFLGEKKPRHVYIDAYSPSAGYRRASVGYESSGEVKDVFLIDRLEPGTYRLRFSGDQLEEKTIENVVAPSAGLEVELMYSEPTLAGTVIDAQTGAPVASFQVRVRKLRTLRGPNYVQQNQWAQFNNERGYFSVETVGPGVYQVQVAAEGYAPTWSAEISTDDSDVMELALVRGGAITGRIIDEEGGLVTGARVIPLSLAGGVMTRTKDMFVSEHGAVDSVDGVFTLNDLPPGTETLKVTHPDYAFHMARDIEVIQGRTTAGVEVVLTPGGTVEGIVYDDQGQPLANEVLRFQDASGYGGSADEEAGQLGRAITDSNGFYRVSHLPEQLCYIKRSNEWRRLGVVRRAVVPMNRTITRVDFGGTPAVRGTVLLQGAPLVTARLLLGSVDSPHLGPFKCNTMTDERGAFVFRGAIPGTHALYRENPDKENDWFRIDTVAVGQADVDLGVVDGRTSQLLVTISGPSGTAPWQITRLFLGDAGKPVSVPRYTGMSPSEAGQPWIFTNIEPGRYAVLAHRADGIQWRTEITLDSSTDTWELSVQVPESTAQISGRIANAAGKTLAFWRQDKNILGAIVPGSDGYFSVENLPTGRYFIGSALGFLYDTPALAKFHLHPHASQTVDLDLSAGPAKEVAHLVVKVVDESGAARGDAHVWLEGALGTIEPLYSGQIGHVFMTPPGPQRLCVEMSGYRRAEKDVTLKATAPEAGTPQSIQILLERL